MKSAALLLTFFFLPMTSFALTMPLAHILKSEIVADTLDGVKDYFVEFEADNTATTWTYLAIFHYDKVIPSRNGDTIEVPCVLKANYSTVGGVAGTETSEVTAEESCGNPR